MKLATLRIDGCTTAAWLDGDLYRSLPWADIGALLADDGLAALPQGGDPVATIEDADHAPLILRPAKIFCVGMNYRTHVAELGMTPPMHPTLFSKFHTALVGATDPIAPFAISQAIDWEAELVVVIGRPVSRATADEARAAITGYTMGNDVSARDLQLRTDQWLAGKTVDATTPLGPRLITADEFDTTPDLSIRCLVNDIVVQEARTGDLLFDPVDLIMDISSFCRLEPGDLIFTGTPGGIGAARQPRWFLKPGDLLTTEIETIGRCANRLTA
ncbi:2-hydroxyhepta-2,4-diene-1,7-dioate isomerase [Rhizorhabdus wittichii DC-6]|nr:2-hydroxyhepta-2,4-diene-1,7-dioate isomerase [Rhizorhabdus wittichii DC-6]